MIGTPFLLHQLRLRRACQLPRRKVLLEQLVHIEHLVAAQVLLQHPEAAPALRMSSARGWSSMARASS